MITDGEPTAHVMSSGEIFFNYPPVRETVEITLREALRCTKEAIRINTFMLDADNGLRYFIEQLTKINGGVRFLHLLKPLVTMSSLIIWNTNATFRVNDRRVQRHEDDRRSGDQESVIEQIA